MFVGGDCVDIERTIKTTTSEEEKDPQSLCEQVADQKFAAYLLQTYLLQTIKLMRADVHAQLTCPSCCFSGLFVSVHCVCC